MKLDMNDYHQNISLGFSFEGRAHTSARALIRICHEAVCMKTFCTVYYQNKRFETLSSKLKCVGKIKYEGTAEVCSPLSTLVIPRQMSLHSGCYMLQDVIFLVCLGPTILEDEALLKTHANPILSELRKEKHKPSWSESELDKLTEEISGMKRKLAATKRKRYVLLKIFTLRGDVCLLSNI